MSVSIGSINVSGAPGGDVRDLAKEIGAELMRQARISRASGARYTGVN